jgi:integrase
LSFDVVRVPLFRTAFRTARSQGKIMVKGGLKSETQRLALARRREPYWVKLQNRGHLGFRRTEDGGTWIARWLDEQSRYHYRSLRLGIVDPKQAYDLAAKDARAYFNECIAGVLARHTIGQAADRYIANRRIEKGEANATDATGRIERCIRPVLGSLPLDRIKRADIEDWRNGLVSADGDANAVRCSKDSANRNLTTLKALLNLAHRDGLIASDAPWKGVTPFVNVSESRKVFLNAEQRKRLLEHTSGAFRDLIQAGLLTGARYGEYRALLVSDLDIAQRVLSIRHGKTGPRTVPLSDEAVALFTRLAKSKLPAAYLLTRDDGEPWGHSNQDDLMREAVMKARLPRETVFYTLRHTFISAALKGGMQIHIVAKLCGTSVLMIEKHYGKFTTQDAAAQLNRIAFA